MKIRKISGVILFSLLAFITQPVIATTYHVDAARPAGGDGLSWATAFNNIDDALDAAGGLWQLCSTPHNKIYVKKGTYVLTSSITVNEPILIYGGFPNTANPDFDDRNWQTHKTYIDGNNSVRCMEITYYCVIDGFYFRNGDTSDNGGAVYIESDPIECQFSPDLHVTVRNCHFSNNTADIHGGAIYDLRSSAKIEDCTFLNNTASQGGAIKQWQTSSTISRCIFDGNTSTSAGGFGGGAILGDYQVYGSITNSLFVNNASASNGGAISYHQGWPTIKNTTFADNSAAYEGGAIYNNTAAPTLKNCILYDDTPNEIANFYSSPESVVTYSCVQGGYTGAGNITSNPLFRDAAGNDYHLAWNSPCIDEGTNSSAPSDDLDGNPRPLDGDNDGTATTDMGAYEKEYARVDLRVTSISLDPVNPRINEACTVSVTVRNYGSTDAGPFYIDWYADLAGPPSPTQVGNVWTSRSLAAGASYTMVKPYTYASDGLKYMYAQVDTGNRVEETNEGNNIRGPQSLRVVDGYLIDFDINEDTHNSSKWFGGDDRPSITRNVGVGQSMNLIKDAKVTSAGFRFLSRFDYAANPSGQGHQVQLYLQVRRNDGSVLRTVSKIVPSSFKGGWVMFGLGELWLDAGHEYVFTCYLYKGEVNELSSSVAGRHDNPWTTCIGYSADVGGTPADMQDWSNWHAHSWDFNFRLQGRYIEKYPGDVNDDRSVDTLDVEYLTSGWLLDNCVMPGWCSNRDINWNGDLELNDIMTISQHWQYTWHGYEDLNRAAIVSLAGEMSSANIDASDGNEFKPGTCFIYRTTANRYGKFIVESFNKADMNKLTISWVTYNSNGTVFSSGSGLVIRGTYYCHLDTGLEDTTSPYTEFWWKQSSSTTRSLDPQNSAVFKLMYRAP